MNLAFARLPTEDVPHRLSPRLASGQPGSPVDLPEDLPFRLGSTLQDDVTTAHRPHLPIVCEQRPRPGEPLLPLDA